MPPESQAELEQMSTAPMVERGIVVVEHRLSRPKGRKMSFGKSRYSRGSWFSRLFGGGREPVRHSEPELVKRIDKVTAPADSPANPLLLVRENLSIRATEVPIASEPVAPVPVQALPEVAPADPAGDLIASITNGATFVFLPTHETPNVKPPAGQPEQKIEIVSDGDRSVLRLSDGSSIAKSGGMTGGYSLRVPDEFEAAASGKTITVTAVARAAAATTRFALAYSTNEVGNSGWRWFDATTEWSAFEMSYAVPKMKAGKGDFIGLLAGPAGTAAVEIGAVAAAVVPPAE